MSRLRWTLVALLVTSTVLFSVGVSAERSESDTHREPTSTHVEAGELEGAHEDAASTDEERDETLFGIDLESTPLLVLAVIGGLGVAAACATRLGERPRPLLAVAVIALAWAALDVREVAHQLDESNTGIALIAIAVAAMHVAAGVLALRLAYDKRNPVGAGSAASGLDGRSDAGVSRL